MLNSINLITCNNKNNLKSNMRYGAKMAVPQHNFKNYNMPNLALGLALKNQILFTGNIKENSNDVFCSQIQGSVNLPLKPQTLEFVLSLSSDEDKEKYIKYLKTGSKFFELYSRYFLHQNYPLKDEGELTDMITLVIKRENKARLLKQIIPKELIPKKNNKEASEVTQTNCLNAILGAIIYENEDGFKTAYNFLDSAFGKKIFPPDLEISESSIEKLEKYIKQIGKSWQDVYQETRFFNEQWHYRIHYKDIILSQAQGGQHNHDLREACAQEALDKIKSGEIDLNSAGDNLEYINYKKPDKKRTKQLEEFCKNWNIKINDISLLHKAFLYGEMPDCSALAHSDTYEVLEYIGDAVLGFCTHEILQDNLSDTPREIICAKRHAFVNNKNLAVISKKMGLESFTINRNTSKSKKRAADLFEALVGAIFIDGGKDGINNVYKFLDENFRDDILNI